MELANSQLQTGDHSYCDEGPLACFFQCFKRQGVAAKLGVSGVTDNQNFRPSKASFHLNWTALTTTGADMAHNLQGGGGPE